MSSHLENYDSFGTSVSMNTDGTRLSIGVAYDDGKSNNYNDIGAQYQFSFTNSSFSGGTLESIISNGHQKSQAFGAAVSLNDDGTRMAIGNPYDRGASTSGYDYGATYLISFTDRYFSGASLAGTLGKGYSGSQNLDISQLDEYDNFGTALSLTDDATGLAIGAPGDDGTTGFDG